MTRIDLITGFLGSGKTTFLKKYARYLMDQGMNICILENDFGAVNVDMMLLQDLMGDNCELEMVSGGCDADCHRRRFKTKLISMGMQEFDRVLVEPSGIFDVDEFFDVLQEEPLDRWYQIGNVFAIVDANLEENLSEESEYLLASQAANAGKIILSKTQYASKEQMEQTIAHLNRVMEQFQCKRRFSWENPKDFINKEWDLLTAEDFSEMMESGHQSESYKKLWFEQDKTFGSVYYMNLQMPAEELKRRAEKLLKESGFGRIIRVKGFIRVEDAWLELNATKQNISLRPIEQGQEILIVIGENLQEERIGEVLNGKI